jgi:hypothetical protein
VIAGVGLADRPRKSRWPARMDLAQSASGLLLGLFMWGHMFFVSTILISNDAMWTVTKAFEGYHIFGRAVPQIVSGIVAIVCALFKHQAVVLTPAGAAVDPVPDSPHTRPASPTSPAAVLLLAPRGTPPG